MTSEPLTGPEVISVIVGLVCECEGESQATLLVLLDVLSKLSPSVLRRATTRGALADATTGEIVAELIRRGIE